MRKLEPFERYLIREFVEDYEDGLLSRRDMIRRVLLIAGGVATTATILTQLGVSPMLRAAYAQETSPVASGPRSPLSVAADDPRVDSQDVRFEGNGTALLAYAAWPAAGSGTPSAAASPVARALPAVLVCHENRGLTEHIRDVARRWAVRGYYALAVDLLSRQGGTNAVADPAEIPSLLTRDVDPDRHVGDFRAAIPYPTSMGAVDTNRLAMQGFCFGGITWLAATQLPELKAAAPFYGPPPPLGRVPNIEAAVLGVYSDDPNDFANEGRDDLAAALEAAGVTYQINAYPGTQHAFHNDTGARYNEEQALKAWNDTVAWFAQYA